MIFRRNRVGRSDLEARLHGYSGGHARLDIDIEEVSGAAMMEAAVNAGGELAAVLEVGGKRIACKITGGRVDSHARDGTKVGGPANVRFSKLERRT